MQNTRTLSPETMTAVEMLESITPGQRSQARNQLKQSLTFSSLPFPLNP